MRCGAGWRGGSELWAVARSLGGRASARRSAERCRRPSVVTRMDRGESWPVPCRCRRRRLRRTGALVGKASGAASVFIFVLRPNHPRADSSRPSPLPASLRPSRPSRSAANHQHETRPQPRSSSQRQSADGRDHRCAPENPISRIRREHSHLPDPPSVLLPASALLLRHLSTELEAAALGATARTF